jgi:hypothetical protein
MLAAAKRRAAARNRGGREVILRRTLWQLESGLLAARVRICSSIYSVDTSAVALAHVIDKVNASKFKSFIFN